MHKLSFLPNCVVLALSAVVPPAHASTFPDSSAWTVNWNEGAASSAWGPGSNGVYYRHWSMRYTRGRFLAGGVFSSDGTNWTTFKMPSNIRNWVNDSGVGSNVFVLNGAGNDLWTSPDSTNWTKRSNPGGYDDLTGITFGAGKIVMHRYWSAGSLLVSSNNGDSWDYVDTGGFNFFPGTDGRGYEGSLFGNGRFVFPLFDSVRISTNATDWTTHLITNRPSGFRMNFVGHFDESLGKFFGLYESASSTTSKTITTAISTNGVDWTFRDSQIPTTNSVAFGGGGIGQGFLVCGGGSPPEMWVSTNEGFSWSRFNGPWESNGVTGVAFAAGPSRMVAATPLAIYSAELSNQQNLLANGSFEQPDVLAAVPYPWITYGPDYVGDATTDKQFTGWSVTSGEVDVMNAQRLGLFAADGVQFLDLDGRMVGAIEQIVAVQAGKQYRLEFKYGRNSAASMQVEVRGSGLSTLLSKTVTATGSGSYPGPWDSDSGLFVADGSSVKVSFNSLMGSGSADGVKLDDVRLYEIIEAPQITSTATFSGAVGSAFSSALSASGSTPIGFGASNLPPGLTISSNGMIGGIPTTAGTNIATLSASNAYGITNQSATFVIAKGIPVISNWPTSSPVSYGQALSNSVLSGGSADVAGSFDWTSPADTPPAGTNSLSVTFTPAEASNYEQVSTNITVVVGLNPSGDEDGDGLTNSTEETLGTSPYVRDTDSDGANDYREVSDGTNPTDANSFDALSKGLVAYFPLDGSTVDDSGNGVAASNEGGVPVAGIQNLPDTALKYGGGHRTSINLDYHGTTSLTVSVWLRASRAHHSYPVFNDGWFAGFGIGMSTAYLENGTGPGFFAGIGGFNGWQFVSDFSPWKSKPLVTPFDQWVHIVGTVGSDRVLRTYINGALYAWGTMTGNIAWSPGVPTVLSFGQSNDTDPAEIGRMDQLRIYNRALSATEVGQLYQTEAGSLDSDGDGLTDAWENGFGRYQIVEGNFTWEQAKADAEAKGGHLATITSASESNFVYQMLGSVLGDQSLRPSGAGNHTWLGGTDSLMEGNWRWVTDEGWSYSNWGPTEPNNGTSANYLTLFNSLLGGHTPGFSWNDDHNTQAEQYRYLLEFDYPTDPFKADTDGDGYNDKVETDAKTDPNNPLSFPLPPDADGDGIPDASETNTGVFVSPTDTGTDPNNADTDGDGLSDGVETGTGTYVGATNTGTDPNIPDTDGDGLSDSVETNTGVYLSATNTGTSPLNEDTSGDGITDGEAVTAQFNPLIDQRPVLNFLTQAVAARPNRFGFYNEANVMHLGMGGLMIRKAGNVVNLDLQWQTKTSLTSAWTNFGAPQPFFLNLPGNKAFIRLQTSPGAP